MLPLDLVYSVADYCSIREIYSLCLLNQYFHRSTTPILYGHVNLSNVKSIRLFCRTIVSERPNIKRHTRSLVLRTPWGDIKQMDALVAKAIRDALHLLPSVENLVLSLAPAPFNAIFHESAFPFRLRRFSGPLHASDGLARFLSQQTLVEELCISHTPRGFALQDVASGAFPNLRRISAGFQTLQSLLPSRPLTQIACTALSTNEFTDFGDMLCHSAMPVQRLDVVLLRSRKEIVKTVQLFIDSIPTVYDTLEHLHVTLSFPLDFVSTHNSIRARLKRYSSSQEFEELRLALANFSKLQTFTLSHERCNNDLTPEFCHSVNELSQLEVWKSSSPSLVSMSLFGVAPA